MPHTCGGPSLLPHTRRTAGICRTSIASVMKREIAGQAMTNSWIAIATIVGELIGHAVGSLALVAVSASKLAGILASHLASMAFL